MHTFGNEPSQFEQDVIDPTWRTKRERTLQQFNVALAEITVFCGPDNRSNASAGYRKALAMIDRGGFRKALVINTVSSTRWALEEGRAIGHERVGQRPSVNDVVVCSSDVGRLWQSMHEVGELVDRHGFDIVILNAWEMASFDSRTRDRLIFELRSLIETRGITILVYSGCQMRETAPAGVTKRGSLGRLAVTAARIVDVQADEEMIAAMREDSGTAERVMRPMHPLERIAAEQEAEREGRVLPDAAERFVVRESKLHLHELATLSARQPLESVPVPERQRELVAESAMAA